MNQELLHRYFEGIQTTEEEEQLLAWVESDPAHRQELLAERRLYDASLLLTRPAATRQRTIALPYWAREVAKYAAAVAVTIGAGWGYLTYRQQQLLEAINVVTVPAGQHVTIALPDGTKVCMNALSELKYPSAFVGKQRRVQLQGEAFFEVNHNPKQPFVVETYVCDVEALGTKFDVDARAEKGQFTASLIEGRVRVIDRKNRKSTLLLNPNERALRVADRFVKGNIPEFEQFRWREGLIAFRDASFAELISEFEKYYGVQIQLRRPLPQNLFTGKIRISEGLDHALWVLQRSANFTFSRNEGRDVVFID